MQVAGLVPCELTETCERLAVVTWQIAPKTVDATIVVGQKPGVEVQEQTLGATPDTIAVQPFNVNIYSCPVQ